MPKYIFRTALLTVLLTLLAFAAKAQEEIKYKEYSYSEFFQMIEAEEDSIFTLENAYIRLDTTRDKRHAYNQNLNDQYNAKHDFISTDTLVIDKEIRLRNVFMTSPFSNSKYRESLHHIVFKKAITLINSYAHFVECKFEDDVGFRTTSGYESLITNTVGKTYIENRNISVLFKANTFLSDFKMSSFHGEKILLIIDFQSNTFGNRANKTAVDINLSRLDNVMFSNNSFININRFDYYASNADQLTFQFNKFGKLIPVFDLWNNIKSINFNYNLFQSKVNLNIQDIDKNSRLEWQQFENKLIALSPNRDAYPRTIELRDSILLDVDIWLGPYEEERRAQELDLYNSEIKLRGIFKTYFEREYNKQSVNQIYIEMKDLETERLRFIYSEGKSFKNFFTWKINQFLKIFSAYGTEPAKAIVFSAYVILAFALVYLFFPNHWDSHGKDRILHRYQFFFKYLNKDAGMQDVYLEGKKDELAHYDGFKNFFIENGKTVPKFFLATALPLYRWSTASTRTSSWFLKKVDVFKGKWSDLPAPQRAAKTIVLSITFLLALGYDIFIKMLNALMLSINTFTTLGFGEIPIKGLPRYLAIIQGFIGWFMLTIFSVSLISQLLN